MTKTNWSLSKDLEANSPILSNGESTFYIGIDEGHVVVQLVNEEVEIDHQFLVKLKIV